MTEEKTQLIELTKNLKVLYVEDVEDIRNTTLKIFSKYFENIDTAVDGLDGLEKFKNQRDYYDLIITDILMPNMDGLEMIKNIKSIKKDVAVIIISTEHECKTLLASIALHVDGYIVKPFQQEQFTGALKDVAERIREKKEGQGYMDTLLEFKEAADAIFDNMINNIGSKR